MGAQLLSRAAATGRPAFASEIASATTTPYWFGPADRPLLGWLTVPARDTATIEQGVVICAPVAYEYWGSHRSLRALAEALACRGVAAFRFDYDGTGDSAGDQWDPQRLDSWRASCRYAAGALRFLGCKRLSLAGLRLGAALALLEARHVAADAVACWAPVVSGRRYRRELEMLGTSVPEDDTRPGARGGLVVAGFALPAATLEQLAALDLAEVDEAPACDVLVIDRDDRPAGEALCKRLEALGSSVSLRVRPGTATVLDVPAEDACVPQPLVDELADWLAGRAADGNPAAQEAVAPSGRLGGGAAPASGRAATTGDVAPPGGAPPSGRAAAPTSPASDNSADHLFSPARSGPARIAWKGSCVLEEVVSLAAPGLAAVRTAPCSEAAALPGAPVVVFLNSGAEPHVGPGRAWVEFARHLACHGITALRVDFPGWGETPGMAGQPYDAICEEATLSIVRALHDRGERVVLAGLCAGAWVALRACLVEPVCGVVALNVQLYFRRGDPVEARLSDTRRRRAPERRREEIGRRTGWWTAADLIGLRSREGRTLDRLRRAPGQVLLVFAEGDDGLEYLRNRLARRMAVALRSEKILLSEVRDIDHPMHREWRRPEVAEAIAAFAERVAGR